MGHPLPSVIGRYEVLRPLGAGGMGEVFLARGEDGRMAAVKVMREHIARHPQGLPRLRREIEALRRIQSPHVARILDYALDGAPAFVATRYVEGLTVEDVVARRGALGWGELRRLGVGLALALQSLQQVDVIHRDIKPSNVMLVDGEPVVIDLGIALVAGMTRMTYGVVGSPAFIAPEVQEGRTAERATDVYGWGVVMKFAATGGDDVPLPQEFAGVIEAALARDPAARPQAHELVERIESALGPDAVRESYRAALDRGEHGRAEALARQIDALAPEFPDAADGIRLLLDAARDARDRGALEQTERWYARGRELAAEHGARDLEGWALDGLAHCARRRDDHELAGRYSAEALGVGVQLGELAMQAWSLTHLGHWARSTGRLQRAIELYGRARDFAAEHGLRDVQGWAGDGLGGALLRDGQLDRAAEVFTETRDLALEIGYLELVAWSWDNLGNCALRKDDPAAAEPAYRESLEIARNTGNRTVEGWALINLARCRKALHDPSGAAELCAEAEPIARDLGNSEMLAEIEHVRRA
nr:serine/threonine-protein kinase [Actinomadura atramentaria]